MYKIIFVSFVMFVSVSLKAQLENTRWKSTLYINEPINVILDFKKDTVSVYTVADSSIIETMTYKQNDTSFTLLKIDGQSDCGNDVKGIYHFLLKQNVLTIQLLNDDCYNRSYALQNTEWKKWKDAVEVKPAEPVLK